MCGIAGKIEGGNRPVDTAELQAMAESIARRGPDDQGIWQKGSVGLVHRRLSIIDLSPGGKQPMISSDGRFIITYNGEIYNYKELRKSLEQSGVRFRSKGDTEVLLHLYRKNGKSMLSDLRGMFAFAIWDQEKRELFFARDPLGQKPFFYRSDAGAFTFGSDLRTIRKPEDRVDWEAVRLFFGLQYVPSPRTGYKHIFSLSKGSYGLYSDDGLEIGSYISFPREPKLDISLDEAAKEVRRLLERSVQYRLVADVPVGLFLSGGIDSACLAYLANRHADASLKTFTMGFGASAFDERKEAAAIAEDLKTDHYAFEANPAGMLEVADRIIAEYAAPYADSSALPTFLLAGEASNHVKTLMTGDGGDELFAGYRRYRYFALATKLKKAHLLWPSAQAARVAASVKHDPRYARFAAMLKGLRTSYGNGYAELFTGSYFHTDDSRQLLKMEFMESTKNANAALFVTRHYPEALGPEGALDFDLNSYLPDDLNVKMDRATMAHGLEARSPFQDHELVGFAARLPSEYLFTDEGQKPLLRRAMKGLVPDAIFDRPKKGFQVPLADWFRGPLRSAFEERCLSSDAKLLDICERERVLYYLRQNDRGEDHGNRLWMLYSLATWLETCLPV